MQHNFQILKVEQTYWGLDTRFRHYKHFCTGGALMAPPVKNRVKMFSMHFHLQNLSTEIVASVTVKKLIGTILSFNSIHITNSVLLCLSKLIICWMRKDGMVLFFWWSGRWSKRDVGYWYWEGNIFTLHWYHNPVQSRVEQSWLGYNIYKAMQLKVIWLVVALLRVTLFY